MRHIYAKLFEIGTLQFDWEMNNYIVRSYRDVIVVTKLQQEEPVKHRV